MDQVRDRRRVCARFAPPAGRWLLLGLSLLAAPALGAPPDTLLYDGTLLLADGETPVDGPVTLRFALFDAAEDGVRLWPEAEPEGREVQVSQGRFQVEIGPLTADLFDAAERRYLEVTVGAGDAAVALRPRQAVGGAAFALLAHEAGVCQTADVAGGYNDTIVPKTPVRMSTL